MDALELLSERIDIVKLMEHYNFADMSGEDTAFVRSACKLHDGDEPTAFVANTENGRWYCHTGGCGGGDAFTLVQRMEECTFKESILWLAKFFSVELGDLEIMKRKSSEDRELKAWMRTIQSRRERKMAEFHIPLEAKDVLKFRDFSVDTLQHFGLKWVESFEAEKRDGGTYTLRNRLLFPIIQNGKVIGASLRRIRSKDMPKWSHQPVAMQTGEILYNYDITFSDAGSVVVVEGIPDVWAYHEIGVDAVATFGAHLTDKQLKLLLQTGKDVVLSYDGDEAGQLATKKAIAEMRLTTNLSVVQFAENEDPANLTKEELLMRYEQRR